ncbi:hypothetical protein Xmau_00574 [Xenorhabdus mauleonii]|uniref:Uncharacterized protein n=1 Tax=Xenorhabdus mauleonii TaxID=351675 RepID=A0A1I3JDU5_9GAMM|nr:hypothetical protein Xmau_00574 [Xenorhabdus mauleonii]SFI58300.1 hypothetical protein SAMN05421680_102169 [Xenorhabdus mauleonii]
MNIWSKLLNSKIVGYIIGMVCAFLFGISPVAEEDVEKLVK